ncbi:MAG: hypothetical protein V4584_07010 [Verrucomicrobiota bacterium]
MSAFHRRQGLLPHPLFEFTLDPRGVVSELSDGGIGWKRIEPKTPPMMVIFQMHYPELIVFTGIEKSTSLPISVPQRIAE